MNTQLKKLLRAARISRVAHAGQKRKHGSDYFSHPKAVARILWNKGNRDTDLICAAYLHDVVEDTDLTLMDIHNLVGWNAAMLVASVTKFQDETLETYYARIKSDGPLAIALKLADREHNNSELHLLPAGHPVIEKARHKTDTMLKVFGLT